MSLNWSWKDKYGEVTAIEKQNGKQKEWTFSIYGGNALAIFLYEWEENGKEQYQLQGFLCDVDHAKRCFGMVKGKTNIYENYIVWKINTEHPKGKKLAELVVKSFKKALVEVYQEEI